MFRVFNPNPALKNTGDCVIRAVAKATEQTWDDTYMAVAMRGFSLKDMPEKNYVWGSYLHRLGFKRFVIPDTCPDCYTVKDFCQEHDKGVYVLCTGSHAVTVADGQYFDTWDSGDEVPQFYWRKM